MALDLIRARCPALEATVEEDDGEVELSLGLSLGGSSRKAARAGAPPRGRVVEARAGEADEDLGGSASSPSSFPRPPPFPLVDGEDALERTRRREIHAFRRREARRKRDDKKQQQKRGICRPAPAAAARGFPGVVPPLERAFSSGDRLAMEAREYQIRAKDREARVEEALDCVSNHKLSSNHNPNPTDDANSYPSFNPICSDPNLVPFAAQSFPVVGAPYSYPHLQYVPITNGFGIPCVMPCWAPAMSPAADGPRAEGNVFHPVACRAFQQCSLPVVEPAGGRSPPGSNSNTVDTNDRKGAGVESAPSWTASQGSSSSPATSGHRGGSLMRGGSNISSSTSDGRSRPSHTHTKHHPRPSPKQATGLSPGQSDTTTSLPQIATDLTIVGQPPSERSPTTTSPRQNPPVNKPDPAAGHSSPPRQAPPHQLPHMPCVSATGNGPNGRTITGVLYRYTKSEVCIVCACHGSSFSPAEFVEHAGGTDVTHPLRQITVVSS